MTGSPVKGSTGLRGREEGHCEDETGAKCDHIQDGMRSCGCGQSASERGGRQYRSESGQGPMLPEQKKRRLNPPAGGGRERTWGGYWVDRGGYDIITKANGIGSMGHGMCQQVRPALATSAFVPQPSPTLACCLPSLHGTATSCFPSHAASIRPSRASARHQIQDSPGRASSCIRLSRLRQTASSANRGPHVVYTLHRPCTMPVPHRRTATATAAHFAKPHPFCRSPPSRLPHREI
jgi:hypothetical protein